MALNYHKIRNGITLKPTAAPGTPENGDVYYDSTANLFYFYQNGTYVSIPTSVVSTVGTFDSQSASANGLVISGTSIYAQSASASNPGMVNTTTQTMAGAKTFSTSLTSPTLIGGTIASSTLTLESTSGTGTSDSIILKTGSQVTALTIDTSQNTILGTAALATSATNGFLYLATCAGTPSGTPTSYTGRSPVIIDTTDNKFYYYNAGWQAVGGGGSSSAWPTQFANSESQLTTAISNAVTAGGGIICINGSFTITSTHTIPTETMLLGQLGSSVLTVGSGGSLTLAAETMVQNLYITTAQTGGVMVVASGDRCTLRNCKITVPGSGITVCIQVTGNSNLVDRCIFAGVAGTSTGIGIQYSSGVGNSDNNCVFLS